METATKETIDQLRASSDECIDNGAPVNIPAAMSPGDMLPQGDIGLLMLAELPPRSLACEAPEGGQLAPGNTQGSRHVIPAESLPHLKFYRVHDGDELSDLCIEATAPFDLTHPEHADHLSYPPGIYRVRHQQNAARQRVID